MYKNVIIVPWWIVTAVVCSSVFFIVESVLVVNDHDAVPYSEVHFDVSYPVT